MAIAPLDQRLNEMTQDSANLIRREDLASTQSVETADPLAALAPQPEFQDQGVQVAGPGGFGKMVEKAVTGIKDVTEAVGKLKIGDVAPPPPTKAAQDAADIADLQKVTSNAGIATKTEGKIAGKIEKAKDGLPTPEQVIADKPSMAGKTGETIPEVPFNMPLMDTTDSIKQTMLTLAKNVETKRGTFADWKEAADASGFGTKFIDDLTSGKLEVSPENVILASRAHIGAMDHLDGLLTKVADGTATDVDKAEAVQTMAFAHLIQQEVKGYTTNIAQSLAAMRMPRESSTDIASLMETFGSQTDITKFAQAYLSVKTPEGKAQMIKEMAEGNTWEKMFTVYVNNILGLGSVVKNTLSNTVFMPWRMGERTLASVIGSARTSVGLGAEEAYLFGEVPAMMSSIPTGLNSGWQMMAHAWNTGVPKGWADPTKIARQQSRMELFNTKADGSLLSTAIKGMNFVTTLPGRSLMATDEFFRATNYTAEMTAEAYRIGTRTYDDALKAGGTADDADKARKAAIDNFMLEPPDYVAKIADKGIFAQKMEGMAADLQNIKPDSAAGFAARTQIPFVAVPVNVMAETVARTPLGVFSKGLWTDLAKGGTKESDMALAKIGMGSAALATFSTMAVNGSVTGSGPGDKAMRQTMERQGWQAYSMVFDMADIDEPIRQALSKLPMAATYGSGDYKGKIFVSYQGLEPVGALIGMSADYADYVKYEQDDSRINAFAGGMAFGFANYMMEHPFLTGVSNIATLMGGHIPNNKENFINLINGIAKTATYTVGKAVTPIIESRTSVSLKEKIDPIRRDYAADPNLPAGLKGMMEAVNKLKSETPGWSDSLDPKLNYWAEPVEYENTWSPLRVGEGKKRPVDQALIQMGAAPSMPSRSVSMKDPNTGISADTKLTSAEYNRMLQIANDKNGLNLEGQLQAMVDYIKPIYDKANIYHYQKAIKGVDDAVFNGGQGQPGAKDLLLQDPKFGPAIRKRIEEKAAKLKEYGMGAK